MLHQPHPSFPKIRFVLSRAYFAESDEATYFLIMLRVLATEGFDKDGILAIFNDLFVVESSLVLRAFFFIGANLSCGQCPLAWYIGSLVFPMGLAH